ncbi:hypothetical protein J437_LFUL009061 [Ladona fulva]|uniref:Uncharacterized protein n=1 Tax=Ladona fulva TaxID=123851 RepID=A0A8K0K7S0_LADFU|nr:hypothetical protein J437_LFUL009061 [Ladona fulva]
MPFLPSPRCQLQTGVLLHPLAHTQLLLLSSKDCQWAVLHNSLIPCIMCRQPLVGMVQNHKDNSPTMIKMHGCIQHPPEECVDGMGCCLHDVYLEKWLPQTMPDFSQ